MAIRTGRVRYFRTDVPSHGADVVTFDNKRLGTVKNCGDDYFQVDGRWGRDYWLSSVLIRNCEPGRVTLHVSRDALGRYKLERPGFVDGGSRGNDADGETPALMNGREGLDELAAEAGTNEEHNLKFRIRWPIAFVAVGLMSLGLLAAACEDNDTTTDDPFGTPTNDDGLDGNGLDDMDGANGGTNGTMKIDGLPGGTTAVFTI